MLSRVSRLSSQMIALRTISHSLSVIQCQDFSYETQQPIASLRRSYHSTSHIAFAKKDKGKGKKEAEEDDTPVQLPDLKRFDSQFDNTVQWYNGELSRLKVGRITIDMFTSLPVESYGTVGKAGQATLKTPTKLVIALYDPAIAKKVAEALRNCGMGLAPEIEGSSVTTIIPRPSQEARDGMLKTVSRSAEKAKESIRNVRKTCMDEFKKLKGKVSEDDVKRLTKDLDKIIQAKVDKIEQAQKLKEKEINALAE